MKIATKFLVVLMATFAAGSSLEADTFKVDPVHSFLLLKVQHLGAGFAWGRFADLAGTITIDPADPSKDAVDLTVKTATIDTGNAKRDEHLRSPDFFNVKQFPEITFKSTKVTKIDDKTLEVTGNFTILGVTKPATATLAITGSGKGMQGEERMGFESNFTLKRTDYGMNFMVGPLSDEVKVFLDVEGIKQ